MRKVLFLLSLLLPGLLGAKITETTLSNGLKIIIKEDHRSPVMVSQIWYKVGSSYEHGGITGISHMLEHMMFKGTKKYKANEFSRIISALGGRENAFTGRDYTAYFQRMEKSLFHKSFELEADRMQNLMLDQKDFIKERSVVSEERRMRTEDDPEATTVEQFLATSYINSPYHHPIIGWMNDIKNYKLDDLATWYKRWYAPNNAVLVVAGDVNPKEVIQEAKKYFGSIESATIIPPKPRIEIAVLGARNVDIKVPAKVPYLIMGYPVPTLKTAKVEWEPFALDFLAYILDGGRSSRISTNLIRGSKIAASAGVGYDPADRLQTLFILEATPSEGKSVQQAKEALLMEIENLKKELVTPEELERARAQFIASKVYERDSVFYQAMQIGKLETIGLSWQVAESYVNNLKKVNAEQIRQVAQKFLTSDKLISATLTPQQITEQVAKPQPAHHNN